jgi:hypothetical protein
VKKQIFKRKDHFNYIHAGEFTKKCDPRKWLECEAYAPSLQKVINYRDVTRKIDKITGW